jgi:hypothetical protein
MIQNNQMQNQYVGDNTYPGGVIDTQQHMENPMEQQMGQPMDQPMGYQTEQPTIIMINQPYQDPLTMIAASMQLAKQAKARDPVNIAKSKLEHEIEPIEMDCPHCYKKQTTNIKCSLD